MTQRPTLLSFASGIAGTCLLFIGVATAEATPITWHWAGPVTGYRCMSGGPCDATLDTIVPLGTTVDVFLSLDPDVPTYPNSSLNCLWGYASTSLQVLGRTYTSRGFVWDEAYGFGPGICVPGYDVIEVVVPSWGSSPADLALPGGWVPFSGSSYLPGLWWGGDLTSVQPMSVSSQFPYFYQPRQSIPQRFTANLQAQAVVPEPSTWLLLSTGLSVAAWMRRR
jgi:hypothetical protein